MNLKERRTLRHNVELILQELYNQYKNKYENDKYLDIGLSGISLSWDHKIDIDNANHAIAYLYERGLIDVRVKGKFGIGNYHITSKGISYYLSRSYKSDINYWNTNIFTNRIANASNIFAIIIGSTALIISIINSYNESNNSESNHQNISLSNTKKNNNVNETIRNTATPTYPKNSIHSCLSNQK